MDNQDESYDYSLEDEPQSRRENIPASPTPGPRPPTNGETLKALSSAILEIKKQLDNLETKHKIHVHSVGGEVCYSEKYLGGQ